MLISSIRNKEIFKIIEENQVYYGSNQEWFERRWQRMSGCGPSAVANIIYYLGKTKKSSGLTKKEYLKLMNEVWNYVTPGLGGISSTEMLCKGANKYLEYNKRNIKLNVLNVPKKLLLRPDFGQVISFLMNALDKDSPVAFLNLEHGTISELESWHWVTIISLEYDPEKLLGFTEILDGGRIKKINLSEWLKTTRMGGGFVSFIK